VTVDLKFGWWARPPWKRLSVIVSLVLLCVAMVLNSLTQYLVQDEEQFVTAAYLAEHIRLYTDFIYLQPPIYPVIVSKILMSLSNVSPFLVARLVSATLAVGAVVVFFRLALRLSKNAQFAFMLAALFASVPLMLRAYGETRNDIMPIFFGLCGIRLLLDGLNTWSKQPNGFSIILSAGVFMALAVGAKVTAAFIPLGALFYILLREKRQLLPFVLGGVIGSLPILYYAVVAPDKFLYGNVVYHLFDQKQFYIDTGRPELLGWPYQLKSAMHLWFGEPTLIVASFFIVFSIFVAWRRGQLFCAIRKHAVTDRMFVTLLFPLAIPFVFLPTPFGWPYLQPAVPYVLLSCAAIFPLAQKILNHQQMLAFAAIALVVLVLQILQLVVGPQLNSSAWTVTKVHDLSEAIARYAKGGLVATTYPALVLDAGSPVYPEFSTSIFFFRTGDLWAPKRVMELKGVSPRTLSTVLGVKPPSAVFIANLDADPPLLNWAQRNCYVEIDFARWQGYLYVQKWKPRLFVRPRKRQPCESG
jgi:4-amino-4-deoxy-L-arabinose transferase-like glycosyltransferase